jgi:hypothetical protein
MARLSGLQAANLPFRQIVIINQQHEARPCGSSLWRPQLMQKCHDLPQITAFPRSPRFPQELLDLDCRAIFKHKR